MKCKKVFVVLLTIILVFAMATPVLASPTIPELEDKIEELEERIAELEADVALRDMLIELLQGQGGGGGFQPPFIPDPPTQQPPPPPPAAPQTPNPQLLTPQNITVNAGETVEVEVVIRNIGTGNAQGFLSQAAPSAGAPFAVEFLGNSNNVTQIRQNGQISMRLQITVDANAESGNHTIALTNHFRNQANENRTTTNAINVRVVGGRATAPNVRLSNFQNSATTVAPGQAFTISANIQNPGNIPAQDVQVSFHNLDPDVIFFTGDLNQAFFANMAGGASHTLSFPMQASTRVTSGTHQINFRVTFRGATGDSITETFPAFVTVTGAEDGISNLEIRNMTSPSGTINVGRNGTVSFYVHNTGDTTARNIRVEATPENNDIVPVQTSRTQIIQSLAPGESQRLSFSFSPLDTALTRSYGIGFTVSYGELSFQQFAVINVNNPDQGDTDTGRVQIPRVIVSAMVLDPPVPRAGQEFGMEITFRNTSATRAVNNVRIIMEEVLGASLPGQQSHFAGFNPVGGSSTLFIDDIGPHEEITMSLRFTTVTEATPGAHNMRFSFDYQDQDFETHSANQQISISVAQVTRLELSDVNIGGWGWSTPQVGAHVPFSYNIINSGRVNLINVRTSAEGPFDVDQAGRFIGSINAQRTIGFDGVIVPHHGGMLQGEFIVTGEDITGEIITLVHPFEVFVEEGWGMDDGWAEGGGFRDPFDGGGMGMGMGMDGFFDFETGEFIPSGYWDDNGEWVQTWEFDFETGEWREIGGSFDLLGLLRSPVVWIPAAVVVGLAVIVVGAVIVSANRKKSESDDEIDL